MHSQYIHTYIHTYFQKSACMLSTYIQHTYTHTYIHTHTYFQEAEVRELTSVRSRLEAEIRRLPK